MHGRTFLQKKLTAKNVLNYFRKNTPLQSFDSALWNKNYGTKKVWLAKNKNIKINFKAFIIRMKCQIFKSLKEVKLLNMLNKNILSIKNNPKIYATEHLVHARTIKSTSWLQHSPKLKPKENSQTIKVLVIFASP